MPTPRNNRDATAASAGRRMQPFELIATKIVDSAHAAMFSLFDVVCDVNVGRT